VNPYKANNAYVSNEIMTASPNKLVLMLFDGAIKNLKLTELAMKEKNIEKINEYIQKTQKIIVEFMSTLNHKDGGDVAKGLQNLYAYMFTTLIQANTQKDLSKVQEVRGYMEELRGTWAQI
jgi:flagellar secretion chaperone FliS